MMRTLVACGLLLTALFYYGLCANDLSAGYTSDDAVYLLLTDLHMFADQTRLPVYTLIREQALFPPLFPILLGLLGGGSAAISHSAMISTGLLLLSIVTAGRWLQQQTHSLPLAIVLTGSLFLLPGTLILAQEIWSEFLFMLLLYTIFIVAGRDIPLKHQWLILAVLIALATLTRTAGIALLPPFWLLLYRSGIKPLWQPAAISTLPFLAWYIPKEALRGSPGYTNTLASSISDTGTSELFERMQDKFISMFESLHWLFASIDSGMAHTWSVRVLLLLFLALAARVLLQRIIAGKFDALFCITYGCMILVWPFDDIYYVSRFLYPLMPVFLLYICTGITGLMKVRAVKPVYIVPLFLCIILIEGPSIVQFTQRAYADVAEELKPYRRDRSWLLSVDANETILQNTRFMVETLQRVSATIPEDECIYAFQAPLVMLYTKRVAGVLPPAGTPDEQFRRETALCRYILALPVTDTSGNTPEYYPLQRLRASAYEQTVFYADPQARYGTTIYLLRRFADTIAPE